MTTGDAATGERSGGGRERLEGLRRRFLQASAYHRLPGGRKKLDVLLAMLLPHVDAPGSVRLLDIGCGNGGLALPAAALGYPIVGVDVDEGSIRQVRSNNRFPHAEFRRVEGDDFDLGERFDVVICSEVLEHLHEPEGLTRTIVRHLRPDGAALVTVPNGYGLREVLGRWEKLLRERLGLNRAIEGVRRSLGMIPADEKCRMYTSNPDQEHVQKFTFGSLRRLLAGAGLEVLVDVSSFFIFSVFFQKGADDEHLVERLDSGMADALPRAMASGWYVVGVLEGGEPWLDPEGFRRRFRELRALG